jgi:two-component system OmpR family sensor kinase
MKRSFRTQLAIRFTATMVLAAIGLTAAGYWALRSVLNRQIDATLLSVASIQAVSVTDDPTGDMEFHEWDLSPEEAESLRDLIRYAQVWSESGESLLRSRYMTSDLPLDRALLDQAAGGPVWREDRFEGEPIRALYYPLGRLGPSHIEHVLEVAAPLSARDRTLELVRYFLVGIVLIVGGGTFAGSWWLGARMMRPVHEIIDQTEEIGADTLGRRIRARADASEYARLVTVLNMMLDRIDGAFEAQRRFTADASHELRSPLTAIRGELDLALRREREPAEYRRVLESALEEAERLTTMADDLLTLARSDAGEIRPRLSQIDLRDRLTEALDRQRARADALGIRLRLSAPRPVRVIADGELLERLVRNLTDNALKFTPGGGTVDVSLSTENGDARIQVSDDGPGIPAGEERVFERFYRAPGAPNADGSGLGLAIVRAIARAHGGEARAENRAEGGACIGVRIPRDGIGPTGATEIT